MKKYFFLIFIMFQFHFAFSQQPDTPIRITDTLLRIPKHLLYRSVYDSLSFFIKIDDSGTNKLQSLGDTLIDALVNKYLELFEYAYRSEKYLSDDTVKLFSTPLQKIQYLISYCLLSNILPTRTIIERLLRLNPCILVQNQISPNYEIVSPLNFKIKRREIKKLIREYYKMDTIHLASRTYINNEGNVYLKHKKRFFESNVGEDRFINYDFLPNPENSWKIVFYIFGNDGNMLKDSFTVSYHGYQSSKSTSVTNASPAYAELPPGEVFISVTKNNSIIPLKIKEPVIYVKDQINNARLDPYKRVLHYQENKKLSRKDIFIIFIYLIQ